MNKLLGGWAAESRAGKMGGRFPLLPPPPAKGGLAPLRLLQGMLCASLLPNFAGAVCALCLCFVRPRGAGVRFGVQCWLSEGPRGWRRLVLLPSPVVAGAGFPSGNKVSWQWDGALEMGSPSLSLCCSIQAGYSTWDNGVQPCSVHPSWGKCRAWPRAGPSWDVPAQRGKADASQYLSLLK